jgi:hypothetical protein
MGDFEVMTEGEVWKVKGLLDGDEFEMAFTSWDSMDPERKARTFYEQQTFLINTSLTRQHVVRSWDEVIASKDGPETRDEGYACAPDGEGE